MIAQVAVNRLSKSTDKLYDYRIPERLEGEVVIGSGVEVPFGRGDRLYEGFVLGIKKTGGVKELKEIDSVWDTGRVFDEKMLSLIYWMREKYLCGFVETIKAVSPQPGQRKGVSVRMVRLAVSDETALETAKNISGRFPAQARALEAAAEQGEMTVSELCDAAGCTAGVIRTLEKKGLAEIFTVEFYRDPLKNRCVEKRPAPELSGEQQAAYERIRSAVDADRFEEFLLRGVTGSGKTEVFMAVIDRVLKKGRKAVLLVPEISLTQQMIDRFLSRFGSRIAVFHSALSSGERFDEWRRMRDGEADIAIGARSAVFAPFDDIGVIIMDEEHSETYKSELSPRYSTHEVARFRAQQHRAPLILASATPSTEDYKRALDGEYTLIEMLHRVNNRPLPAVKIVDMRQELAEGNKRMFSRMLAGEIKRNLSREEQTILLMNRRGFSTFVSCRSCGYVAECPNCSISLTYHKTAGSLRCHYCGYTTPAPKLCPVCSSKYIRHFGGGTQRVEAEASQLFPEARILRMDVDTTETKEAHEKILTAFKNKEADILIGTQMVAKGLDFENVTLVGVVSADTMLHINDYRSAERTFAMLEQVTGRAGRGRTAGRAVVQTYDPGHEAVKLAKAHDYRAFYEQEITARKAMWYPPFCEIESVQFSGESKNLVMQTARFFARCLEPLRSLKEKTQILGPIEAQVPKIKNKYRWQILIKSENIEILNEYVLKAQKACKEHRLYRSVAVVIDKNPNSVY